jgi:hypothetical protein
MDADVQLTCSLQASCADDTYCRRSGEPCSIHIQIGAAVGYIAN